MSFVVRVEPMSRLAQHASIPIAFLVERIFEISGPGKGLAGTGLTDVTVERPWEKDYDAITGESPTLWLTRFDTTNWGLIAAYDGADRVGGAVIAFNTQGVNMLEGQDRRHLARAPRQRLPRRRNAGESSGPIPDDRASSRARVSCEQVESAAPRRKQTRGAGFTAKHFRLSVGIRG